jgi:hypothetical protein
MDSSENANASPSETSEWQNGNPQLSALLSQQTPSAVHAGLINGGRSVVSTEHTMGLIHLPNLLVKAL